MWLYRRFTSPADQFCRRFTFAEIQAATCKFSDTFVIGEGGFGKVYKGIIDNGATVVAIKRLDPMSKQGGKELSTEIEMLSKFRHRHVVSLIGYCDNNDEIILVYEYMKNGSLADHLYEGKSTYGSNSNMSWVQRVKICIGVAQALDYLHSGADVFHRVRHGDVKSSNILLDENWDAKISDFGLSVIVPEKQPYVSTHVKGTLGYCDPEYIRTGILTEKSDVYSFGVVLLEVLSGRRAVNFRLPEDQKNIVQWGQHCIQEDKTHWLIDLNLEGEIQENSLKAFVKIAGQCLRSRSKKRPTMSEVVASLEFALALHTKKDSSVLNEAVYDFGETVDNRKAKGVQSDIVLSSTILKPLPPNSPIGQSEGIEKTSFAEDTSSDESTVRFVDFNKGGLKRKDISMWCGTECHLMNSGLSKLPENMNLPVLRELLLQDNYDLSEIPPSFFEFMPALQVLDMSRTSIKYLPPSISNLVELQKLLLRGCKLLMELPAEIRALKNLEVFDLAGTELIYIPKEIEMLSKLEHLEVSLCACADEYISEIKENGEIIPRKTLSKLLNLKELSIFVDPDCEWWYAEVEAVIQDLFSLEKLERVKLYFPTVELLQKFLQLPRVEFQSLSNFRLIVGRHDQGIISRVPPDLQDRFEILDKCLKFVNGEGNIDGISQVLKQARALFLDRHWTIDRLSTFKADEMDKLRFCLLVECNEMITVIDRGDNVDKSNAGKPILGLLQYLSIHYMKNLESISVGPLASGCLYNLQILALHTCPKLTTIFNVGLLSNLVNLKELIVEDCPKVESLVTVESSHLESDKKFLPSLEKISLLHLPGLVSISSGLCVAQRLQRIVVYNCPKLQSLSPTEIFSIGIEEIKGESEWWEALEWKSNQPDYLHRVFVPLRRDGLMNQLAEARNTHNTLSMIQNTSKIQERSEAPKLDNWESEDVPHADYFKKASDIQESELPVTRTIPGRSRFRSRPATYDDENAKTKEVSYAEELRWRKETEEALGRKTEELEMIKERDELQVERDNALRVAEELRRKQEEQASSLGGPQFFSEFSFFEIEEATSNFDPTLKIGEGGYGSIYKGLLRHTQVAIKMLHSHSSQGPSEFQQEVNILSKVRHPNLVTLVGACPESWIIIYEYLPNGSLEDRLICKDNTPPLSWQTRIRIATELCSVLIFLHSSIPHSIIHGDLKPANILLDSNYVSKLSDFGLCRVLSQNELSSNNTTLCCRTDPKGTFAYMDPEFFDTGELTTKSDVYSFGIILLRLLTGRPALGIIKEVEYALDKGNLKELLDPSAGDWPFVQAKQLVFLAISCCNRNRRIRPDFASEVWRVLEPMRVSCGASSFRLGSEERVPRYFICPIFQEIMQDPVVAADGFSYEAEALKGWLDSGHDTSPITNLKLQHCNLLPNHALRSAIQEWLQQK